MSQHYSSFCSKKVTLEMWYLDKRTAMTTYATLARYPWCHHFFPKPSPIQMCIQRTFFKISSRLLLTIKRWFLSAKCIRRGCVDHRQKCCERNLCNLIDSQVKLVSLASSIWCGLRFLSLCSHVLLVPRGWMEKRLFSKLKPVRPGKQSRQNLRLSLS